MKPPAAWGVRMGSTRWPRAFKETRGVLTRRTKRNCACRRERCSRDAITRRRTIIDRCSLSLSVSRTKPRTRIIALCYIAFPRTMSQRDRGSRKISVSFCVDAARMDLLLSEDRGNLMTTAASHYRNDCVLERSTADSGFFFAKIPSLTE